MSTESAVVFPYISSNIHRMEKEKAGFEVLTALSKKKAVFWVVAP
jgi:hypothetical protein